MDIGKCHKAQTYWHTVLIVRVATLKAYNCIDILGRKINLSGQNAADPFQIRYTWTCQGVTTFRQFWARSADFGQNGGWDESRRARVLLCGKPRDLSATSQRHTCSKLYTVMYEVSYNGRGWTSYVSNCRSLFDWKDCSARQLTFLFGLATAKKTVWICHRVGVLYTKCWSRKLLRANRHVYRVG